MFIEEIMQNFINKKKQPFNQKNEEQIQKKLFFKYKKIEPQQKITDKEKWENTPYEKKFYDIFNLYYYISKTDSKPKIGFAYLKNDVFRDCSTNQKINDCNIVEKCFVFDGGISHPNCTLFEGVFYATTPSFKYKNNKINFTYFEQEPKQHPYFILIVSNQKIKSYDVQVKPIPSWEEKSQTSIFNSSSPQLLPFFYEKENNIGKQPKLCLHLKDLEKSQHIINNFISKSYKKINEKENLKEKQEQEIKEIENFVF